VIGGQLCMKAHLPRKRFYEAVQVAARAVTGRSSLPILNNVYIQGEGEALTVSATDLEMGIECTTAADIKEPGKLTAPAKVLTEIISTLPDVDVHMELSEKGALKITCGTSDYNILTLPADEFPLLPEVEGNARVTLPQAKLRQMIRQTIYAVSTDDTRPIMTGLLLIIKGEEMKFVATDTHRLALRTAAVPGASGEAYAIVPSRAMNELQRMLSGEDDLPVEVIIGENQIKFSTDHTTLISRLIEGQFPNFERVVPKDYQRKWSLEVDALQDAVRRAAIVARENANRVVFKTIDDKLAISSESGTIGKAYEEVELVREGDDLEIAFNARYLLDTIATVDTDGVNVELQGPLNPGVVKPADGEDYLCIIMPMQLGGD
jgi:DNA polymerase-3 subunit beta